MDDDNGMIQAKEARSLTQLIKRADRIDVERPEAVCTKAEGFIAVIESRTFIRECIRRSMQSAFPLHIHAFSEASELREKCHELPKLIVLSEIEYSPNAGANVFRILSQIAPRIPIIVLAYNNETEVAKAAIGNGAKGYIPVTLGYDIAIEAVRFVFAGRTYVPIDYLLMRNWSGDRPFETPRPDNAVTPLELAVVRSNPARQVEQNHSL
ncbi:MAG: hypothetical protein WB647_07990 [Roseiarcus sp.]|uniref:hypothetical protein n=1 Tax=Roseiarcus sp. TaxID=1969460 RepID=UPI003C4FDA8F